MTKITPGQVSEAVCPKLVRYQIELVDLLAALYLRPALGKKALALTVPHLRRRAFDGDAALASLASVQRRNAVAAAAHRFLGMIDGVFKFSR